MCYAISQSTRKLSAVQCVSPALMVLAPWMIDRFQMCFDFIHEYGTINHQIYF